MTQNIKRISLVVLAIVELVTFATAIGTVGYFMGETGKTVNDKGPLDTHQLLVDLGFYGRQEFFLSAAAIGLFTSIISLVIAIANLQEKTHWAGHMITLHAFCALFLLISASLLAKTARTYDSKKSGICKGLETASSDARCYQLTTGVVFGFISMALFIADTIIYISNFIQSSGISFVNMENVTS